MWPRRGPCLDVDGHRIDLYDKHLAVVGGSGSRKSTLLARLIDGKRPTLVITGDRSLPLVDAVERAGSVIWRPDGQIGWDILAGRPGSVVQRLTAAHQRSSGDTGLYRSVVADRALDVLEHMEAIGEPRSLDGVVSRLRDLEGDRVWQNAAASWVARLSYLRRMLGPALGSDLELGDAMRWLPCNARSAAAAHWSARAATPRE
jgi:hypothetical protein